MSASHMTTNPSYDESTRHSLSVGDHVSDGRGMKVTDKMQRHLERDSEPFYTFEVFPPKTDPGLHNLIDRVDRMCHELDPSWVHVTWGAGGTTQLKSLQLCEAVKQIRDGQVDVCLHVTCTNMEKRVLDETLQRAKELGVRNLLALRGDPPRGEEYWVAACEDFQHATDLIKYIRKAYGDWFCIGVAGYPEGHCDSHDKSADIEFLLEKQKAGADFVVTQLFYDCDAFMTWYKACRDKGISIPILPGIMPIQNYQSFRRMTNLCKSHIPPQITADLEKIQHDDASVKDYGVNLAVSMMQRLYQEGICGFHLCTLNLEKSVTRVLHQLGWVKPTPPASQTNGNLVHKSVKSLRQQPGVSPNSTGTDIPRKDSPTSWDEFPNGRFGDARSPAYGEMDGYGVGLKLPPAEALKQWGSPTSLADVSRIFTSYLRGTQLTNPWSEEPLRPETQSIADYLVRLNDERHWWTVGSQPAVDGASSSDKTFGFGPKGGYVYQKAFVEFFLSEQELKELERKSIREQRERRDRGEADGGLIKWFAANRKGETRSNMNKGDVNAVTWGVFAGKDIVTTTLIEEMSFRAWNEEAFAIWLEWSHLYPAGSPSRKLLRELADTRWLVSVTHHDYKDSTALWKWLLDEERREAE
ncbi:methylenetetrahydrofolate reductase 1 [Microbotryomycetes sp. JL201]|nr:methylenetetrahydrofolate reductase 1 [Microbotryomycetes sp. JL201]